MDAGKLVSCGEQWHLFDADWQLLETLDPELIGLRGDEILGTAGGQLLVKMGDQWQQLDSATFELLGPVPGDDVVVMDMTEIKENHTISWQRLMQDLHSGRWFGGWGVWVRESKKQRIMTQKPITVCQNRLRHNLTQRRRFAHHIHRPLNASNSRITAAISIIHTPQPPNQRPLCRSCIKRCQLMV